MVGGTGCRLPPRPQGSGHPPRTACETPYDVPFEEAIVRLRRYEPVTDRSTGDNRSPLFIIYPFINDPSILDFHPDRSVISGFLEAGYPVFVLEWRDASPVDRSIDLRDVITRYLPRSIDVAREDVAREDAEAVHLLGYSTGAPLAAAVAGLSPDRVKTLTLQGPPLDFDAGEGVGLLRRLTAHQDTATLAETLETVPPAVLEGGFTLRKPVEYAALNPTRLWDNIDDSTYVDDYGRKLTWTADGPAILIQRENPALPAKDVCSDALSEPRTEQGGSESRKLRATISVTVA